MLTLNTRIYTPGTVSAIRNSWEGPLWEALALDERVWDRLYSLPALNNVEDGDSLDINEAFKAIAHLDDEEVVQMITDDPNAVILTD